MSPVIRTVMEMSEAEVVSFPAWRRFVVDGEVPRVPSRLVEMLDAGLPVMVSARNSASGRNARLSAVADLRGAFDELKTRTGIDFGRALPPDAELVQSFDRSRTVTSSGPTGARFSNTFVEFDLRARAGLVVLLSTGSGHKLDDSFDQPFVEEAARLMRHHQAALAYFKRLDRAGRQDWALGKLMNTLQHLGAFIGDEDGIVEYSDAEALRYFLKGQAAKKQAAQMPAQTRREQLTRTGDVMVDGIVRLHTAPPLPPGFGVCWLQGAGVTPSQRIAYLDMPGCRPAPETVAYGLADVYVTDEQTGERVPVDQVANVRWALKHLYLPGWTREMVVRGLIARHMSTTMLRDRHGRDATLSQDRGEPRSFIRTLLDNLDVYETGRLTRAVGGGFAPKVIEGCLPPDGPWASAQDFARIRQGMKNGRDKFDDNALLAFSGIGATYDGRQVVVKARHYRNGELQYRCVLRERSGGDGDVPDNHVVLNEASLRHSVAAALMTIGDTPLDLLDRDRQPDDDPVLSRLRSDREIAQTQAVTTAANMDRLMAAVSEVDHTGQRILTGAMLARAQQDYAALDTTLIEIHAQIAELQTSIDERVARMRVAETSDILYLLEGLRAPLNPPHRHIWRAAITQLRFTSIRDPRSKSPAQRVTWTGTLRFEDRDTGLTLLVPFAGEHERRRPTPAQDQLQRDLADDRDQILTGQFTALKTRTRLRPLLADQLGIPAGHYLLTGCNDPTIAAISAALLADPRPDPSTIAEQLEVDIRLVQRIAAVHSAPFAHTWLLPPNPLSNAFFDIAADHSGRVTPKQITELTGTSLGHVYNLAGTLTSAGWIATQRKKGYLITPCQCGSQRLTLLRLREADGPVCLHCRNDRSSIQWEVDPYDQYR
jgi:hypothetical protein